MRALIRGGLQSAARDLSSNSVMNYVVCQVVYPTVKKVPRKSLGVMNVTRKVQ